MKKILFIFTIMVFYAGICNASAYEVYYTNSNNVSFTKEEYEFISKILYDGYQKDMTLEEYNNLLSNGISDNIQKVSYETINPLDTEHTTANKSLTITKVKFPSYSLISVVAKWLNNPVVRSYDLIGAYLDGVSLTGGINTKVSSEEDTTFFYDIKNDTNGFGVSVKLPDKAGSIIVSQTFSVIGSGNVYASYQHATSNKNILYLH